MTEVKPNPLSEKKKVWEITLNDGKNEVKFNILARTVNAALSKGSKYRKEKKLDTYEVLGAECIAIIDF